MAALQILITYCPGLNEVVFGMAPMDGVQWGIVILFMFVVFLVMETEKAVRRYLSSLGEDTDDREYNEFFDAHPEPHSVEPLPKNHLNLTELSK